MILNRTALGALLGFAPLAVLRLLGAAGGGRPAAGDRPGVAGVQAQSGAQGNAAPPSADAEADLLARRAAQHAKAIDDLLNGRTSPAAPPAAAELPAPPVPTTNPPVGGEPAAQRPVVAPPPPPAPVTNNIAPSVEPSPGGPLPVVAQANVPPPEAPTEAAEQPAAFRKTTPQVPPANESLEQEIARRAHEYPRDLASQLDQQLVHYLKDDPVPDASDVAALSEEDRNVLTALLDGLVNFRTGVRNDSNLLIGKKIRPLLDMADRLRSRADLSIPTAAICSDIRSFGVYTPIDRPQLPAGVASKFAVYCEVANFSSQLGTSGKWESKMTQELTLYAENGFEAFKARTMTYIDSCRVRRHDFFLGRPVEIPGTLPVGPYTVKITVVDQLSNRVAETSLPVEIVAGQ